MLVTGSINHQSHTTTVRYCHKLLSFHTRQRKIAKRAIIIKCDNEGLIGKFVVFNNEVVPMGLMNLSLQVQVIHNGNVVAIFSEEDEVIEGPTHINVNKAKELNSALQNLFNRSSRT